jgi:putative MATE family efflux protein
MMNETENIDLNIPIKKPENKMGTMPVRRLLFTMAIPMILSMVVQALYFIVDTMFVAQVSEAALTAISLAYPAQNLSISVAVGTAVGVNALLSKSLGEHNQRRVNKAAENGIFLMAVFGVVFIILGVFFTKPYILAQTSDPEIIKHAIAYTMVTTVGAISVFMQILTERLLISTGKTHLFTVVQMTGVLVNVILDPLLIFGIGPFPQMQALGAGVATVVAQTIASAVGFILNKKKNHEIQLHLLHFKPSLEIINRINIVGIPGILMTSISSITVFVLNLILVGFSTTAAATLGVYLKLNSIAIMPCLGICNAMVPIIAYNYGAKNKKRIIGTVKNAILFCYITMIIALAIFQILPGQLMQLFNASDFMMNMGVVAIRIITPSWLFAGFCIVSVSVFQALGNGMMSLLVSFGRQLVILVPAAYLLSLSRIVSDVWFAFLIAECMSLLLSALFLRRIYNKKVKNLEAGGV